MSWNECPEAKTLDTGDTDPTSASIELVLKPRTRDLGGFEVRRALPSGKRQMVGP
ncbi:MAG: pirin family protein, partial [Pseudomonadota bacterium]